jgi:adenosylcobinamide kinase / adenosylcobinamide-phosphate guanylyltransferase
MGRLVLVGGGARSGKSRFALQLAETVGPRRVFMATAEARDDGMLQRIQRHLQERGDRYRTVETPVELVEAIGHIGEADVVIVDCLTLWLSNLIELGLDDADILGKVAELVRAAGDSNADVIVVSNEVGLGLVAMTELGRRFQDLVGWAHQAVAISASEVYLAVLGCVLQLKPSGAPLVWPVLEMHRND